MVISAEKEETRRRNMALSPSRRSMPQSRFHNFSFPTLSWGNQKLLRCVNLSGRSMDEELHTGRRCSTSSTPNELPPPPPQQPRVTGHKRDLEEEEEAAAKEANPLGLSPSRPWNLRSRRAARNAPAEIFSNRNTSPSSSQSPSFSHSPLQKEKTSSPVILVTSLEGFDVAGKGERRKFSIALSREEIEEDFLAAKGTKPPRRPKKRAKYLQRQLDALFPGLLLSEVTSDLYKIEEIVS